MACAVNSALPSAVSHGAAMLGFSRVAVRDLNARRFRSRARTEAERDAEAGAMNGASGADRLHVFASGDVRAHPRFTDLIVRAPPGVRGAAGIRRTESPCERHRHRCAGPEMRPADSAGPRRLDRAAGG